MFPRAEPFKEARDDFGLSASILSPAAGFYHEPQRTFTQLVVARKRIYCPLSCKPRPRIGLPFLAVGGEGQTWLRKHFVVLYLFARPRDTSFIAVALKNMLFQSLSKPLARSLKATLYNPKPYTNFELPFRLARAIGRTLSVLHIPFRV